MTVLILLIDFLKLIIADKVYGQSAPTATAHKQEL